MDKFATDRPDYSESTFFGSTLQCRRLGWRRRVVANDISHMDFQAKNVVQTFEQIIMESYVKLPMGK